MNASPQLVMPRNLQGDPEWGGVDWHAVLREVAISRALDDLEESRLLPERRVLYQFSARGHELTQVLLGQRLTGSHDGVGAYYRSRPLLLSLGLELEEALASTMMRTGGMSEGRDIGVVFNLPRGPAPVCCRCAAAWARSTRRRSVGHRRLRYRTMVLGEKRLRDQHRSRARRGCFDGHQRFLGGAQHRDHRAAAAPLFHRGQRLRHIGAVAPCRRRAATSPAISSRFRGLRVLDGDGSRSGSPPRR
jgi:hypothetical protein